MQYIVPWFCNLEFIYRL